MEERHHLRWKGRVSGPHTLGEIRARLASGEISRAHQIETDGEWRTLEEFLRVAEMPPQPSGPLPAGPSDEQERSRITLELKAERARSLGFQHRFELLREQHVRDHEKFLQPPPVRRMSALAIAALIVSVFNFVPFMNLFSWLPSLILAESALSAVERDQNLYGRNVALMAFALTACGLALSLVATLGWGFSWMRWW